MDDRVVISKGLMENQSCSVFMQTTNKNRVVVSASGFPGSGIEKCVSPCEFDIIALRSHTPWGHDEMSHL